MTEKSVPLYVRITPEQSEKLKRLAAEKDRSVAWIIRKLIDRAQP